MPEGSGHARGTPVLPAARPPVTPLLETRGPRGATSKRGPCAGPCVPSHGHRESRLPLTSRPEEPREATPTGDVRPHPATRAGKQPARQRVTPWPCRVRPPPSSQRGRLVSRVPRNPSTDTPGSLTHNSPRQDAAREPVRTPFLGRQRKTLRQGRPAAPQACGRSPKTRRERSHGDGLSGQM